MNTTMWSETSYDTIAASHTGASWGRSTVHHNKSLRASRDWFAERAFYWEECATGADDDDSICANASVFDAGAHLLYIHVPAVSATQRYRERLALGNPITPQRNAIPDMDPRCRVAGGRRPRPRHPSVKTALFFEAKKDVDEMLESSIDADDDVANTAMIMEDTASKELNHGKRFHQYPRKWHRNIMRKFLAAIKP